MVVVSEDIILRNTSRQRLDMVVISEDSTLRHTSRKKFDMVVVFEDIKQYIMTYK